MRKIKQIGSALFKAFFPEKRLWHVRMPYSFLANKYYDTWHTANPAKRKEILLEEIRIYESFLRGKILISFYGESVTWYNAISPKVDIIRLQ